MSVVYDTTFQSSLLLRRKTFSRHFERFHAKSYWSCFFENGEHNSIILFCLLITTNCSFFITFQTVSCAWTHLLWNYFTPKSVSDNFLAKKIFLAPYILFFKSIREGEVLSQIPLRIWECDSVILCKDALTILVTVLCFLCIPN